MKVLRHKIELLTGTARAGTGGCESSTGHGVMGPGVPRAFSPRLGDGAAPSAPPLAPAGVGSRPGPARAPGGDALLRRGEPSPGMLGEGERSRQPPGKGARPADSRGMGVPGGLPEHPCGASLLLSQPPLGASPLPRRMRWAAKEAALSNSRCETARAPPEPLVPPPPPDPAQPIGGSVSLPGSVAACSCTPQLDHSVRLDCGGCWGRPVSLSGSEKAVRVPPALVEQDVAQAVSLWGFPLPHRAPPSVLLGGNAVGTQSWLRLSRKFPSSLFQLR